MEMHLGAFHYPWRNKKVSWGDTAGALHAVREPVLAQ